MLMHHKLIGALAIIAIGCFLAIKFNIWFIIIALVFFGLILLITKDQNVLKIVVPAVAIIVGGAFAFGFFTGPSEDDLKSKLSVYEADLKKMQKDLNDRQQELKTAKKEQGWLKSTFKDSDQVNNLERKICVLQDEVAKLEKDIYDLKEKLRKIE